LIQALNRKHGCRITHLSPEVLRQFEANAWPGNVRELRNVIERAAIVANQGEIQLHHLPEAFAPGRLAVPFVPVGQPAALDDMLQVPMGRRMSEVEEAYLRFTLQRVKNNKRRAAEMLGLCLRTLHNKIHSYEQAKVRSAGAGHVDPE
jgi:DNA-binding NtrC family response regulator